MIELAADELRNLSKVWTLVFGCVWYTYTLSRATDRGFLRLLSVLPVVILFFLLPLNLTSIHLTGTTGFFISWLGTFKLLLFAFGRGPLCSDPSISFSRFLAIACFPIKLQQTQSVPPPMETTDWISRKNGSDPPPKSESEETSSRKKRDPSTTSPLNYIIKVILMLVILKIYDYSDRIHPNIIWLIYLLHIYFMLELELALVASAAKLLGLEIEPQFNEPYLSTSLQDFWGRRWNLMVSSILRPTVYEPVLCLTSGVMGDRRKAQLPATLATFAVSGIMHELIFYYMSRMRPNFMVMAFFMLHGLCLCAEILLKRSSLGSRWRIPRVISGPLTVVFVVATGFWLFLPPMLRGGVDVRAFQEYSVIGAFLRKHRPTFV